MATKIISLMQGGTEKIVTTEPACIDLSGEKVRLSKQFPYYVWNMNARLLHYYRNKKLQETIPLAKNLYRLPYIVTAEEAVAFFRLPLYEKSMSALRSNQVSQVQEQFSNAVVNENNIQIGKLITNDATQIMIGCSEKAFTKHALVVGTPGSGKTTFSVNLLLQFARRGIPFLAIEPTKSEYRAMIEAIPDLRIFTPGNNAVSPYIINPFIPPKGIRIEQYIPSLASAFKAAFSMPSPLDMIFLKAIRACYIQYGWKDYSMLGDPDVRLFGIYEFILVFKKLMENTTYSKEVCGNIESAGLLRLSNLIEQNSNIYDTIHTVPIEDLLTAPTVLELNSIDNAEQKSLIMALLLINICIYTKHNQAGDGVLKNAILIDEAHVLLGGSSSGGGEGNADSQGATIKALQDMIAEIRSYGTSIIIADQSPTKVSRRKVAMCDMDCGDGGGFDVGADSDISERADFDSGSDVDVESSFEAMDDVDVSEDISESFDGDIESEEINISLDSLEDVETVEEFSPEMEDVSELAEEDTIFGSEISESNEEMLELSQLDAMEQEIMDAAYLEELERENADNPECIDGKNRLIDEGRINVVDSVEITEEVSDREEDVKVLTREVTEEVLESRERDMAEVLDNYRENLEERGVEGAQIETFLEQERDKMNAEYESLDRGDTSSNIYDMPTNWDEVADALGENASVDIEAVNGEVNVEAEENEGDLDVSEEPKDISFLLETDEDKEVESQGRFITYYPEEIESDEVSAEYSIEMPELMVDEEAQEISEEITDEEIVDENIIESGAEEALEEVLPESDDLKSNEELSEMEEDLVTEVSEINVNYDEIYEEIENEALEQGYKDVNIEANAEFLEQSLERFDEDNWKNYEIYEQREAINDLSDYIKDIIGFKNPPTIEYYDSGRKGEYGYYDSATNTVRINENMLYNSREAADTVAHELWHAHQQECAMNPKSARDYQYQYNFDNYISSEYGMEQYQNQLVEAEARSFASQFKGRIK